MSPTNQQLHVLIVDSANVHELDERVSHRFGGEHIPAARLLAVQICGPKWVFGSDDYPASEVYKTFRVLGRPRNFVLLLICTFEMLAFLWPPFLLQLQDGGVWHMGFFSIFDSQSSVRHGAVNVFLLFVEMVTIAAIGACAYLIAGRIEGRNWK